MHRKGDCPESNKQQIGMLHLVNQKDVEQKHRQRNKTHRETGTIIKAGVPSRRTLTRSRVRMSLFTLS